MRCPWHWLIFATLWASCSSYVDQTEEMRLSFNNGDYAKALEKLRSSDSAKKSQNRLLFKLEEATILDRMGEFDKSKTAFLDADRLVDELYTESISKTATSFVVNDASADYSGEDYEKVAIHTMLALQFIERGQFDEARVEARRINTRLNEINSKYDDDAKNKYAEDAFARYLAALIYESRGEWDSAIIDYTKALELYQGSYRDNNFIAGPVPKELVRSLYRLLQFRGRTDRLPLLERNFGEILKDLKTPDKSKSAWVVAIHEVGRIARKTNQEFVFPVGRQIIRFSFPVIRPRAANHVPTGVTAHGRYLEAENVEYMDGIAHATLENRRLRMVLKQGARLLVKGQLTEQAYRNFGIIGGLAANAVSAVSETGDTRSWTTLPQTFYISRIAVAPGPVEYSLKNDGRLSRIKRVDLKPGQILLVRDKA